MRIAIAGLLHESNTFASQTTDAAQFRVHTGEDLLQYYADTHHEIAGFISGAAEQDFEPVPLLAAEATPSGTVTAEAYEELAGVIVEQLRSTPSIDGVLLALHGAMVSERYPQADAESVRRVREVVGGGCPVVVTHDYHANVPPEVVDLADALVVYQTNPHVDQRERGLRAADIVARTVRGEVKPVSALAKPELLLNIYFHNTSRWPMAPLLAAARELEEEPGILSCSVVAGYQYADVPAMGPSIVVVADGDQERADREAERLGARMWSMREELTVHLPGPAEAVRQAMAAPAFPVTLLDFGDNIGGGSAGDSSFLLEQLLAQQANGWVVTLWDPEAARVCASAGICGPVVLDVGGKTDSMHGPTLTLQGVVRTLHDGTYQETERRHGGGRYFDQGLTAVVGVGRESPEKGGLLVLNSQRSSPNSIHQITCCGIQPQQQKILVAKGAVAPRAAYEPVSAALIEVDSGGATAIHRPSSEYTRARSTLYEWRQ